jgi:hypothetical protein
MTGSSWQQQQSAEAEALTVSSRSSMYGSSKVVGGAASLVRQFKLLQGVTSQSTGSLGHL